MRIFSMLRFVLMRHGQAEHNVAFKAVGESAYTDAKYKDASLTSDGINQCNESGETLGATYKRFAACYTSSLRRCIQTALLVNQWVPFDGFYCSDELMERGGGGHICNVRQSKTELLAEFGEHGLAIMSESMPEVPAEWYIREPMAFVEQRIVLFLRDLLTKHKDADGDVLVVTHHDVLYALMAGTSLDNADYIELDYDEMSELVNGRFAEMKENQIKQENDSSGDEKSE